MNKTQKLELIKEALSDHTKGILNDFTTIYVIHDIVNGPGKITEEHIEWGKKVIKEMEERGEL